jgi:hypothetical protein
MKPAESREHRLSDLLEEIRQTDIELSNAALAIARHINEHPDLRTCIMAGRIFRLVGGSKDAELLRLERERNALLIKFHGVLAEYSAAKQAVEGSGRDH